MRHDDWLDLKALFCKAWPTTYGTKSKGKKSGQVSKAPSKDHLSGRTLLHGKSVEAQEHRDAFIRLIQAIWPSDSYLQFFGLRAIKHRSLFHSERLRLATKVCEYLWALMICSWRKTYDRVVLKFDKEGVGNFIESCVRNTVFGSTVAMFGYRYFKLILYFKSLSLHSYVASMRHSKRSYRNRLVLSTKVPILHSGTTGNKTTELW